MTTIGGEDDGLIHSFVWFDRSLFLNFEVKSAPGEKARAHIFRKTVL
jgi:hypothetical protein